MRDGPLPEAMSDRDRTIILRRVIPAILWEAVISMTQPVEIVKPTGADGLPCSLRATIWLASRKATRFFNVCGYDQRTSLVRCMWHEYARWWLQRATLIPPECAQFLRDGLVALGFDPSAPPTIEIRAIPPRRRRRKKGKKRKKRKAPKNRNGQRPGDARSENAKLEDHPCEGGAE